MSLHEIALPAPIFFLLLLQRLSHAAKHNFTIYLKKNKKNCLYIVVFCALKYSLQALNAYALGINLDVI